MNKKVLGIIIGVIAVIALVFFFMSGDKGADNGTSTTDDNASAQQSLSELLASGRSQTCTFSDATDSGSYTMSERARCAATLTLPRTDKLPRRT